jgi:pimeloyl-ACP methyl ester carboxylesterase
MLPLRPLLRRFSSVPAGFRSLDLVVGASGASLSAVAPATAPSAQQQTLLCLPSTFGSAALDFRQQFASAELARSVALYGVDPRVPERDLGPARVERDAEEVLRAADALELERFSLLGCSHGANVSAVLAATHPERVSRLVLVNGNVRSLG